MMSKAKEMFEALGYKREIIETCLQRKPEKAIYYGKESGANLYRIHFFMVDRMERVMTYKILDLFSGTQSVKKALDKMNIDYDFTSLNKYISAERSNRYIASKIKRKDTEVARLHFIGKKYKTPLEVEFKWFVADLRRDLDNQAFCCKYIFDGMVKAKAIPSDNLRHIVKITHEFEKGKRRGVEITFEEV